MEEVSATGLADLPPGGAAKKERHGQRPDRGVDEVQSDGYGVWLACGLNRGDGVLQPARPGPGAPKRRELGLR